MKTHLLFLFGVALGAQGIITTVAGNGGIGIAGDGGPAVNASLGIPQGLAINAAGNIYIAETIGSRIRRIDSAGVIRAFAGNGLPLLSGDGGPATTAGIFFLAGAGHQGLAVDAAGDLLIADAGNGRIRKISNGTISSIAGTTNFALSAQLNSPSGVTIDSAGNIYIADRNNGRIRKIDTAGVITTVAGNGPGVFGGDGGPATSANISLPYDVEVDAAGNLYIADGNGRIRKVDTSGRITTIAGGGLTFDCNYSGPAVNVSLAPNDMVLDGAGNILIADRQGCIRRLDSSGSISTIAGGGSNIPGDGGPARSAGLGTPAAIALDAAGNIYFADSSAGRIRKVTAAPPVSGVAPAIAAGGIVNAASFGATEISPGSIISIFGSGFATA
ncbi:MAG: hypothetical protein FJW32_28785, partial [Acidobacteria bacterium]|nr:hypothetical protein [Acidobacteriota bacterium]